MNRPPLFVLLLLLSCASSRGTDREQDQGLKPMIHLGENWFRVRGRTLGMTIDQARDRDGQLSDQDPPESHFWDEQVAIESASVWRALCNECHGGKRSIKAAAQIPPPEATWGKADAIFFGRPRPHREMFQTIFLGGEETEDGEPSRMPPWGERISREQIWGLVYYIEKSSEGMVLDLNAKDH